ncbi:MAG: hypothetical protein COB26_09935 [Piscirickettsiaceae bacterium]|nr:MAG: hypothetical protein COB26_09935 [Piscirickettsiaceae bacterium]
MFFKKETDPIIAKLENEVERLNQENRVLNEKLGVQSRLVVDGASNLDDVADGILLSKGIFENMLPFSNFIGEVQASMLDVSESLQKEKYKMVRAAEVSTVSQQSMTDIAHALTGIAEDTVSASTTVDV